MVSIEVVNLDTKVPLSKSISIIFNHFLNQPDTYMNMTCDVFKKLLELSVKSFFFFDGYLYKQVEGLGMGQPLGPTFANIFMCFNGKHHIIKFSIEREVDSTLNFLDCTVTKKDNKFVTSVYRKPLFSGLSISYFSFCASSFKIYAIKTLLCRDNNVSANYKLLYREFEFLKQFFHSISFPLKLIGTQIRKFWSKRFEPTVSEPILKQIFCLHPIFCLSI